MSIASAGCSSSAGPHEAVALYRGDFLEGFELRDSAEFDHWQIAEAQALHRELGAGLERWRSSGPRPEISRRRSSTRAAGSSSIRSPNRDIAC